MRELLSKRRGESHEIRHCKRLFVGFGHRHPGDSPHDGRVHRHARGYCLRGDCERIHARCGMRYLAFPLHGCAPAPWRHASGPKDPKRQGGYARRASRRTFGHDGLPGRHQQHWRRLHCDHLCVLPCVRYIHGVCPVERTHEAAPTRCACLRARGRHGDGVRHFGRFVGRKRGAWLGRRGRVRRRLGQRGGAVRLGHAR